MAAVAKSRLVPYLRQYGVSLRSKPRFVISASKHITYVTFNNIKHLQRTSTPCAPKMPRFPTQTCHISTHGTFFANIINTMGAWYHGTPQYKTKSTEKDPQMANIQCSNHAAVSVHQLRRIYKPNAVPTAALQQYQRYSSTIGVP